jgi:ketosteroid isomerase-like protein
MTRNRCSVSVAAVAAVHLLAAEAAVADCPEQSWRDFEQLLTAAQSAFALGNAKPIQALWSHTKDVSIFGAAGGHEIGWDLVGPRLAWAATLNPDGEYSHETLSLVMKKPLVLVVQIEQVTRPKADGTRVASRLRVTHIARCEGTVWRLIHRHADRLTETTPAKPK